MPRAASEASCAKPEDGPSSQATEQSCEGVWLGGRDSNPDNLLQRQMSYRWTTSQCQTTRSPRGRTINYSPIQIMRGKRAD